MNYEKILSGHELVSKGATKIEATLPEIGLKDVFPSGSWLEQKQIQASIEARKHLIEVERIEKSGALSHAEWNEELLLAEVTQKVGGYWQYLGHNKGKQLYLKPEEALFLMEINCLHLKHHDVKVSLQQAYSLLLKDKIAILQYKVYASLSRLGYRVYRHEKSNIIPNGNKENPCSHSEIINNSADSNNEQMETQQETSDNIDGETCTEDPLKTEQNSKNKNTINDENENKKIHKNKDLHVLKNLERLKNRVMKPCKSKNIHSFFETVPELTDKQIVLIKAPDEKYIPHSIKLNKLVFNINLQNIHNKNDRRDSNETNIYTNDEVNGSHIRRLKNTSSRSQPTLLPQFPNFAFANQNMQFKQYNYWRPRQNYNSINFGMLFQKKLFWSFNPRFQTQFWQTNFINNNRNLSFKIRPRLTAQKQNLEDIKKLALRLKHLILKGNTQEQHIQALQRLIQSYNTRYGTRIRLSEEFNIVEEETILDTIELDDDEGPSRKRHCSDSLNYKQDENLNMLKKFASQLKELEKNDKSSARHRRAFSKLLKTFNESYNEEYYLTDSFELENRKQITLDTSDSSDIECITEEPKIKKRKKLKNPFNILKRLSEKQNESCSEASTSRSNNCIELENNIYSQFLLKTFTENWLPPEDDFGRAEIVAQDVTNEIIDTKQEEFLFDFLKIQSCNYDNWLDLKKSFFTSIKEAIAEFKSDVPTVMKNMINSIVKPGDCTDMEAILKKLRIIKSAKGVEEESNLAIDFDVYNRDVQNFRKTKRPIPHFRIICLDETKKIPPGSEIASLHSKYDDNVIIVFAIVGLDSISYLQINPTNLPVYISNNS